MQTKWTFIFCRGTNHLSHKNYIMIYFTSFKQYIVIYISFLCESCIYIGDWWCTSICNPSVTHSSFVQIELASDIPQEPIWEKCFYMKSSLVYSSS